MLSIENALDLYTDRLNNDNQIDLDLFKRELTVDDYVEFMELIPFINIIRSI